MDYTDGIKYLKEHNITKDDGTFYEFGDVSFSTLLATFMYGSRQTLRVHRVYMHTYKGAVHLGT